MPLALPRHLPLALPQRLPFGLRVAFRGAFLLLVGATLALALAVLGDEKQRRHSAYADSLRQSQAQIVARLKAPNGQLMLTNPGAAARAATPVVPLALPFGAIDFDDRAKARQAVELAGCALQYPDGATLCAGIGSRGDAGAFVYVVASLTAGELIPHRSGNLDLTAAHRAVVELRDGPRRVGWIAPFEPAGGDVAATGAQRGRLTAFADDTPVLPATRPARDFRGWLWQEAACIEGAGGDSTNRSTRATMIAGVPAASGADGSAAATRAASAATATADPPSCPRRTWLSMRLPATALREAPDAAPAPWPPSDPARYTLRLRLLPPGAEPAALFDSDSPGATLPFALDELRRVLLPGEHLVVRRPGRGEPLLQLRAAAPAADDDAFAPWLERLVRRLPVALPGSRLDDAQPLSVRESFAAAQGRFELVLTGDLRQINRQLAAGATRVWGFVAALLALMLAIWLALEIVVMRRVTLLTRRAAALSSGVREGGELQLDLKDLRGRDELGVLAQGLRDLLARVNDDVRRERIRAQQEQDQWQAVGHEIMSPLQSLLALHGAAADPSRRYIERMQQAVRVLYGQASPREAFAAHELAPATLELHAFLQQVAGNAGFIGIDGVVFEGPAGAVPVRADEYALEDVFGHLLRNAQRHREPGTAIRIVLVGEAVPDSRTAMTNPVRVRVHNRGPAIDAPMLERIFEYGVSGADGGPSHRGQGLFVARTYLAKMGGSIRAFNEDGGVCFELQLQRA